MAYPTSWDQEVITIIINIIYPNNNNNNNNNNTAHGITHIMGSKGNNSYY